MSEALEIRAEIHKIARMLAIEPEEIDYLSTIGPVSLMEFRDQLVELFYGGELGALGKLIGPSRILPASTIAAISQDAIGPILTARIAGLVDTKQAIAVVGKLPIDFLADVSVELDPRRVSGIIAGLPDRTAADITAVLAERREYVAMGRFAGHLTNDALAATFEAASDADLLEIAFVVEDKEVLSDAVAVLPDKRLRGILRAAQKNGLWGEAIDLLLHLDDEQYIRMVDLVGAENDQMLDGLVRAAHEQDLWSLLVPIGADMSDPSRVIDALLRADPEMTKSLAKAIVKYAVWDELSALLEKASNEQRAEFRDRLAGMRVLKLFEPVSALLD